MAFRVSFEGESWSTDDLTLDEAIDIERVTDHPWVHLNPFRSAADAKAILVAFVSRTRPEVEATKLVGALSVRELLDSVELVTEDDLPDVYEDGLPDPKAGEPGIGGSPGEPSGTGGLPTS